MPSIITLMTSAERSFVPCDFSGANADQIHADKVKLLGTALAIMTIGLAALFTVAMLELSETSYLVCVKP